MERRLMHVLCFVPTSSVRSIYADDVKAFFEECLHDESAGIDLSTVIATSPCECIYKTAQMDYDIILMMDAPECIFELGAAREASPSAHSAWDSDFAGAISLDDMVGIIASRRQGKPHSLMLLSDRPPRFSAGSLIWLPRSTPRRHLYNIVRMMAGLDSGGLGPSSFLGGLTGAGGGMGSVPPWYSGSPILPPLSGGPAATSEAISGDIARDPLGAGAMADDGGEAMDVRELLVAGEDASGLGVGGDALDWGSDVAMGDLGNI